MRKEIWKCWNNVQSNIDSDLDLGLKKYICLQNVRPQEGT